MNAFSFISLGDEVTICLGTPSYGYWEEQPYQSTKMELSERIDAILPLLDETIRGEIKAIFEELQKIRDF